RSTMHSAASPNNSQRPVLASISDAISSPTRCSSSSVPAAAAWSSSKRFVSSRLSGSRSANSSSTATDRSSAFSNDSRANAICCSGVSRCASPMPLSYLKRFQQSGRDALPAPTRHCSAARGLSERATLVRRQREERAQLVREVARVAGREAGEGAVLRRILRLEALRDLREPGMTRDERRGPGCGGLRGDHPEGLREDRRNDAHVRQRKEMREVAVLERPGEERPRRRDAFELLAVVAEADDHRAGVDLLECFQEDVHALVV